MVEDVYGGHAAPVGVREAARQVEAALCEATATVSGRLQRAGRSPGSAATECAAVAGVTPGVARRRVESGARAGTPAMEALRAGRITAAHERVIAEHVAELADRAGDGARDRLAAELVDAAAAGLSPHGVGVLARARLVELDPTRLDRVEELQQKHRSLRVCPAAPDGSATVAVTAEPRLQALLAAVVARFGGPGQCLARPEGTDLDTRAAAAADDTRTPEQRAHDVLCHVLALGLAADPARARGVASIVVRVTAEQLDHIETGGALVDTDAGA